MHQEESTKLCYTVLCVLITLLGLQIAHKEQFQESWGDYARALSAVLLILALTRVQLPLANVTQ